MLLSFPLLWQEFWQEVWQEFWQQQPREQQQQPVKQQSAGLQYLLCMCGLSPHLRDNPENLRDNADLGLPLKPQNWPERNLMFLCYRGQRAGDCGVPTPLSGSSLEAMKQRPKQQRVPGSRRLSRERADPIPVVSLESTQGPKEQRRLPLRNLFPTLLEEATRVPGK